MVEINKNGNKIARFNTLTVDKRGQDAICIFVFDTFNVDKRGQDAFCIFLKKERTAKNVIRY